MESKEVSQAALERNLRQNPNDNQGKIEKELEDNDIAIVKKEHPTFTIEELSYIYSNPIDYWMDFCKKIEFGGKDASKLKDLLLNVPQKEEYKKYFQPH